MNGVLNSHTVLYSMFFLGGKGVRFSCVFSSCCTLLVFHLFFKPLPLFPVACVRRCVVTINTANTLLVRYNIFSLCISELNKVLYNRS